MTRCRGTASPGWAAFCGSAPASCCPPCCASLWNAPRKFRPGSSSPREDDRFLRPPRPGTSTGSRAAPPRSSTPGAVPTASWSQLVCPPRLGNTSGLRRESARATSRISRARRHSGTRCSRFPFVRGAGMLHTPSSLSLPAPSRPRSWEREKGAAGVMEGPGKSSPRSGGRRGRSPSPAPSRVEGRRACLRSRESLLPAAFATHRCLNPVLAAFPRPRSSNRTCRFPASGFQSRSCLRPRRAFVLDAKQVRP